MTRARLEAAVLAGMERAERDVMRWGVDDCALWAADIVKDALGYDPVAKYRGRYHNRFGAMRYICANGGTDGLLKSAARRHGWKRIDPRWARPGDVGLVWTQHASEVWRLEPDEDSDDFDADGNPPLVRVKRTIYTPTLATAICRARGWFVARNERGWTAIKADAVPVAWSVLDDVEQGARMANHNDRRIGMPAPVHEPVSLIILSALAIEATTTAVAVTTFLLTTALSIGFSLVSSMLQPHTGLGSLGDSSFNSVQASVQVTERQSLPYKQVIVGNAYVGPKLFFEQVKPPYLTMGGLLSIGPISGVRSITIGTDTLLFSQITENTILTPLGVSGQPNYPNRFRCCLRYGSTTQATDPLILARYASISLLPVDFTNASVIGTMTNGAYALNETIKTASQSAVLGGSGSLTAIVGVDLGSGHSVTATGFCVTAPTDVSFSNTSVIVRLQASNDNSTWTDLYVSVANTFSANEAFTGTFSNSTAYRYYRVRIEEQSGDAGAHSLYVSSFVLCTGSGSSLFRQRGIATYVGEYHFGSSQTDFLATWGQVSRPNAYISADGVLCYDPRDPTQLLSDESTWKWTNNASLVQAFYLTRDWGGRIPTSTIDWVKVADAANYDDELVGCKDGTFIKRYTVDGVILLSEKPYDILPKLLSANRGYVLAANGKVWVSSSRPKTPIATIHDRIIAGGFQYQAAKAKRDLLNKGQVRFVAEEQDYQIVDGPINNRTDLQAIDQEVLPGTLTLEYTRDHRRAQRLLKAYLDSSRLGKTIQIPVDASILAIAGDELIGNVVNFDSVLWPTMNRTYLITGLGMSDDLATVSLALVEYDASIETAWDPAVDEKDFTLATINVA